MFCRELGDNATFRGIPKAGHLVHLERPCVYNRCLKQFLATLHSDAQTKWVAKFAIYLNTTVFPFFFLIKQIKIHIWVFDWSNNSTFFLYSEWFYQPLSNLYKEVEDFIFEILKDHSMNYSL